MSYFTLLTSVQWFNYNGDSLKVLCTRNWIIQTCYIDFFLISFEIFFHKTSIHRFVPIYRPYLQVIVSHVFPKPSSCTSENILDIDRGRVSIRASDRHLVITPAQVCLCKSNLPFNYTHPWLHSDYNSSSIHIFAANCANFSFVFS